MARWLILDDLFKQLRAFRSQKLASSTMNHAQRDSIALDSGGRWLHQRPLHPAAAKDARRPTWIQRAALVLLLWTTVGIVQYIPQLLAGFNGFNLLDKILDGWAWALLTPAILLLHRRFSATEQGVARLAILWFVAAIPFSIVHAYLTGLISYPIEGISWSPLRDSSYLVFYVLGGWQTFFAIAGILQASRYYNRLLTSDLKLERVEKTLIEARLNALQLQLEPHFLFNAMNAISSEVSANPKRARDMIEDLGVLLRQSLDCKDRREITLTQELTLLEHYLSIQRVRFAERLTIKMEIEPAVLTTMVPPMLLQPLVENAIRHGIERRIAGGTILVSAARIGDELRIHLADDGAGLPRNWQLEASPGLGLRVTRERLAALYPELGADCFSIGRRSPRGTEIAIRIPLSHTRPNRDE